jgi:hypothetical protein
LYDALARDVDKALKRLSGTRRPRGTRAPAVGRLMHIFRERLIGIEDIDFFGSAGRDRVLALLRQLEERTMRPQPTHAPARTAPSGHAAAFQGRLWVTRPRPGVDRMASAWLIRRFIDPRARFGFAADRHSVAEPDVPYDMFGVELSHQGGGCTFETLCAVFGIHEPAVSRIAGIVHDLDLKDGKFGAPECSTVSAMIDGLQLASEGDDALLEQGMTLFESLYRSFDRADRATGPRALARPKQQRRRIRATSRKKSR